ADGKMSGSVAAFRFVKIFVFFFQAEDGIRGWSVTGVQTCALPIYWPEPGCHRLETLRHADDILVLANGRVVEFDRRNRLVADETSRFAQLLRAGNPEVLG